MLEGLQSPSPSISHSVQCWVNHTCHTHQLNHALLPVYQLLADACPPKHSTQPSESGREKVEDQPHAKYYYASLKKKREEEGVKEENSHPPSLYPSFHLAQLVDVPRLQYALSLLQSALTVAPVSVVTAMSSEYSDREVFKSTEKLSSVTTSSSSTPSSPVAKAASRKHSRGQRCLLEIVLGECVSLLVSAYPQWLDVGKGDQERLQEVKTAAATLTVMFLSTFIRIQIDAQATSTGHSGHSSFPGQNMESSPLLNPSYIMALLALCEVQKGCLLSLHHLVLSPMHATVKEGETSSSNERRKDTTSTSSSSPSPSPSPSSTPLFLQLLRLTYCLFVLDTFCTPDVAMSKEKEKEKDKPHLPSPAVISGYPTASQPLFHQVLSSVLVSPSLPTQQTALMAFLRASLPYLRGQLEQLAPLALKHVCKNLSEMVKEKVEDEEVVGGRKVCDGQRLVSHMQTLTAIVHYCLLGNTSALSAPFPFYQLPDQFWNLPTPVPQYGPESTSPMGASASEKPVSTISWLIKGLFGSGGEREREGEEEEEGVRYTGLGSHAGRRVLLMMPIVYRAVCKLWRHCCRGGGGGGGGGREREGRQHYTTESNLSKV